MNGTWILAPRRLIFTLGVIQLFGTPLVASAQGSPRDAHSRNRSTGSDLGGRALEVLEHPLTVDSTILSSALVVLGVDLHLEPSTPHLPLSQLPRQQPPARALRQQPRALQQEIVVSFPQLA